MHFPEKPHRTTFCLLLVAGSSGIALGQERLTNSSFENGTLAGNGTLSFAGGTNNAVSLATRTPTSWSYESANNGNTDLWVESTQARTGTRYLYLSSDGSTDAGNDACMRNIIPSGTRTITGLNGSVASTNTLRVCLWAANGQASASQLNLEVQQFNAAGNVMTFSSSNQAAGVQANPSLNVL